MSFYAELVLEEKVYRVHAFYFSVGRSTNAKGQPDSPPAWRLDLTVDSVNDTTLTKWMIDPAKQMDGHVSVFKTAAGEVLKKFAFKQAFCYRLYDRFIPALSEASCYLLIGGEEIHIGNSKLASGQ